MNMIRAGTICFPKANQDDGANRASALTCHHSYYFEMEQI